MFWPGEHVVDKNVPSLRFHFHNALKPKSLDDTDLVAIVPTPLESPLKLPNWNVLGFFLLATEYAWLRKGYCWDRLCPVFSWGRFHPGSFPTCRTMQCVLWLRQEKEEHQKKPSQTWWSLAQSSEQTVAFMWKDVSIAGISSGIRSLRTFALLQTN